MKKNVDNKIVRTKNIYSFMYFSKFNTKFHFMD